MPSEPEITSIGEAINVDLINYLIRSANIINNATISGNLTSGSSYGPGEFRVVCNSTPNLPSYIIGIVTATGSTDGSMTFTQQVLDDTENWIDAVAPAPVNQVFNDINDVLGIPIGTLLVIYIYSYYDSDTSTNTISYWSNVQDTAIVGKVTATGDTMTFTQQIMDTDGNFTDGVLTDQPFTDINGLTGIPVGLYVDIIPFYYLDEDGDPQVSYYSDQVAGTFNSPENLGNSGTATPDTLTFDITDQDPNDGVTIVTSRGPFYDTTTGVLNRLDRTWTFDSQGKLQQVSDETSVIVDTSAVCTSSDYVDNEGY